MGRRFNLFFRWFAWRFFRHFDLDPATVARLRELESRGSVIYVMRYSSRLDYFLFNTLFLREGLRLSSFANGLHFYYYRPLWEALRIALFRPRGRSRAVARSEDHEYVRRLALEGRSFFLFVRTARVRAWLKRRRARRRHDELDLLEEAVRAVWSTDRPVYVVPLAIFWRKGPRSERRFLNLSYGGLTRPSDVAKVTSFLLTYRSLSVKIAEPIDLQHFIAQHRSEGVGRVARKVRRSILIYLYREEKVVEGPSLRARSRVLEAVLADPNVQSAIRERARSRRRSRERVRREAEKMFHEIAANMNSTFLAVLGVLVGWIFRRMFSSIEVTGLGKVADHAREHPLLLVPNHRSYFDFLLISWLFYGNYLVPPHIAAGINMAFGPFGLIFRRAGAFFLRRTFDDDLYKEVFRSYVSYLVREGFTQEFFIEGGRSRTGKMLTPRLGMVAWNVEAFLDGHRRDLFFVPIAITYERLVEESSMVGELEGAAKEKESMVGLVRARKYLQRRFGSVHVAFGEPISLAEALGERRAYLATEGGAEVAAEKRRFIEELGRRIVERINWTAVANATSVAACVLLGFSHRGLLRGDLTRRMQQVVDLLRIQGVRLTSALAADQGGFEDSIAFLLQNNLIRSVEDHRGEILYFEESRRRALDIYRNSIVHYLATPSFLARALLRGGTREELREDLAAWQELLDQEFFFPTEALGASFDELLGHFEQAGWVEVEGERRRATEKGRAFLTFLAEQTRAVIEAYQVGCSALLGAPEEFTLKEFRKLAAEHFERAQILGEASRSEAINDTTFTNLLDLLVRRDILRREERRKGKTREVAFVRGEKAADLDGLREWLAAAPACR
jgi:glycerol-3-phosphate O-acyltransferase